MFFQTFDDKDSCVLVFQNQEFHKEIESLNLSHTWSYSTFLKKKDVQYAQIWQSGKSLSESCPISLKEEYEEVEAILKGFFRSCTIAGIDLDEVCFYDLVPIGFLKRYAKIKNKICEHVFSSSAKPENYDSVLSVVKIISEIKHQPLKLDLTKINRVSLRDKNAYRGLSTCNTRIIYDPFKTKTGRLSTSSYSFPVLTLAKEYRKVLEPNNDWLFELDFNAAELRVARALLGKEQPVEDIHAWNVENVFKGDTTREQAKKRAFAWLYNPDSKESRLNSIYERDKIKERYFKGSHITTDFKRKIDCDEYHAVNYIIQSTSADLLFEQMAKVWKLLENKKSFIKFCNHDSVTIDLSTEDQYLVNDIKEAFSQTRYGKFKTNCYGGKNWGNMKKLLIH